MPSSCASVSFNVVQPHLPISKQQRTEGLQLGELLVAVHVAGVQEHGINGEVLCLAQLPHLCAAADACEVKGVDPIQVDDVGISRMRL